MDFIITRTIRTVSDLSSNNKTLKLNDKINGLYVLNVFYSAPDGDVTKKYETDYHCGLPVVSYFNRKMDSTQIEVKILIKTSTTLLRDNQYDLIRGFFKESTYFSIGDKKYSVTPLKIKIETKREKAIVLSLFFKSFKAEDSTETSIDLIANESVDVNLGNNCKDFKLVGEDINGSFRLQVRTDMYSLFYTPIIYIPFNIQSFYIDTSKDIYTATNESGVTANLLDPTIYTDFESYRKFIICLNFRVLGFQNPKFYAEFDNGTVTLSYKRNSIY